MEMLRVAIPTLHVDNDAVDVAQASHSQRAWEDPSPAWCFLAGVRMWEFDDLESLDSDEVVRVARIDG